jgi:hypothetical protein
MCSASSRALAGTDFLGNQCVSQRFDLSAGLEQGSASNKIHASLRLFIVTLTDFGNQVGGNAHLKLVNALPKSSVTC